MVPRDHRSVTSARNLAGYLRGDRLQKGEASKAVRVRGPVWLVGVLEGMTPSEIGRVLAEALRAEKPRD